MPTIGDLTPGGGIAAPAAPTAPDPSLTGTPISAPATPGAPPAGQSDFWSQLGAGGYSALNSALLGLPDLVVKTAGGSDAYKRLKAFQDQNKTGSTIGDLAGLGASFFIPGGALLKGGQLLAKGIGAAKTAERLGQAGDFLNATGGPLGQQILRGAGQAATQAIPRAAIQTATTGEPIDAGNVAAQIGLGGAAGGVLGKLMPTLGKTGALLADEGGKTLEDAVLSGADVGTRVVKTALNQTAKQYDLNRYGNFFNNADDFKAGLTKFVTDNNLGDKLTREAFIEDNGPLWQAVAQKFNAAPLNISTPEFSQQFLQNPKIAQYLNNPNVGAEGISNLAQEMAKGIADPATGGIVNDFNQAKGFLSDQIKKYSGLTSTTPQASDMAQAGLHVASALKQAIDEHALSLDPAFAGLKANYPYIQALKIASGLEKIKVENPLKEGSDTFQKLATNAALGGTLGASTSPDDNKLEGGALGAIGGALGVPFASRLLSKVGTQAVAGLAGQAVKAGENPLVQKGLQLFGKGSEALGKVAPTAAAITPAVLGTPGAMSSQGPEVPMEQPQSTDGIVPPINGQSVSAPADGQALPQPPSFFSNPQFRTTMGNKLQQLHMSLYPDMSQQQFMSAIAKKTQNFNDMGQVANVLFAGDPEGKSSFLNEWQNYKTVKDIDINKAVEAGGLLGGIPGTPYKEQADSLGALKSVALANASGGEAAKITPALEKEWENDINQLRNSRGPGVGERQVNPALLAPFIQKWGLDFKNLSNLGVK